MVNRFLSQLAIGLFAVSILLTNSPIAHAQGKGLPVRQNAELVVHAAALGLGGILSKVPNTEAQIRLLKDYVHPIRFFEDNSGYFFVYDTQGTCVAHGSQLKLEGRNLIEFRDSNGFPVIQAIIEKSYSGGGFIEYNWEKPGTKGRSDKLGYVEPIPGTDFIIGTGIYFLDPL